MLASGYSVQLYGFDPWAKDTMCLIRFKQNRGNFQPDSNQMQCGDKCHQLKNFIRTFNECAKWIFYLGHNPSFHEGGVVMFRSSVL